MNTLGKISVRFFLNTNVKPLHIPLLGESNFYPLYVQVTFNRKNTQFRSSHRFTYMSIEEAFSRAGEFLKYEESLIKLIVKYEFIKKGANFDLTGLKDKYRIYTLDVKYYVEKHLRNSISGILTKTRSRFVTILDPSSNYQIPINIYYEAALKLIDNFEKILPENFKKELASGNEFITWSEKKEKSPRVIEWLSQITVEEYKKYLMKKGNSASMINSKLNIIDKAITTELEDEDT